jgi:hypothetical protein
MAKFQVWTEGYKVRGVSCKPMMWGEAEAPDFLLACCDVFARVDRFDPLRLTFWGCNLFESEEAASIGNPVGVAR